MRRVDDVRGRAAGAVPRAARGERARGSRPSSATRSVVNGFSARLDPTSLESAGPRPGGAGVFPVRIAYPAQAARSDDSGVLPAAVADLEVAGPRRLRRDGGAPRHRASIPRIRTCETARPLGRRCDRPRQRGDRAAASDDPGPSRAARDRARRASSPASDGPDGLHGVAPGASILPVRVGGWQPDSEGGYSVYSRTDQILAGLEAAVDPTTTATRTTRRGSRSSEWPSRTPRSRTARSPRAIAGARRSTCSSIVPAGNDGSAGPSYGSIAGPGGAARCADTVGAADGRVADADRARLRPRRPARPVRGR